MSTAENSYNVTKEDVRKAEQRESKLHGGDIPADSYTAGLQSIVDSANKNKSEVIAERQANLPLPDQPPVPSDFNSADGRTVNVGSGGISGDFSKGNDGLREPATGGSAEGAGREGADGLSGLPNDAVTRDKKNAPGLADTTGKDYGYPQKSDPSNSGKS